MLCSHAQLVNPGIDYEDVRLLPCNSWRCEICAPRRQRQLQMIAASGAPTIKIELTLRAAAENDPRERLRVLHDAWKRLVKRMLRQFALPSNNRWAIKSERSPEIRRRVAVANSKVMQKQITAIHYMAFVEAHPGSGMPHLHILCRMPFVPQDWLAEQMDDIAHSPVVWIKQIKNSKRDTAYVTKYVTKSPAQFGTHKRYWRSRHYVINQPEPNSVPIYDRASVVYRKEDFITWGAKVVSNHYLVVPLKDGWLRVWTPSKACGDIYPDLAGDPFDQLRAAGEWHQQARRMLRFPVWGNAA